MRIWNLEVEGENRLSSLAVHHLSDLHYGLHFTDLDEEEAERRLEKHPWIQEANVEWDFPSTVRVEIVEETTHALLAMEKMWYVNENGIPFRVASPLDLDYPIISGIPNSWAKKHPHVVKKIIDESLHILQICTQTPYISKQKVSEIYFQKNAGFTIILRNGSKIIFGFYPPEDRIERLTQMIESGLELSSPKQIVLDAEKVAVVMPLN
ncbi:MAG: FtsQ-type POTRA domain-containing protein [Myxococcota bacterium]|nr:FtsQ-type POTRA domain-containing protein [Myxococcota bacterium]